MAKRKMKAKFRKPKTGLNAVPFDKGLRPTLDYFHSEVDRKEIAGVVKNWVKNNYDSKDAKALLALPEWRFATYTHYGCVAYWEATKQKMWCKNLDQDQIDRYAKALHTYFDPLVKEAYELLKEKALKAKEQANIIVLSPMQRLQKKIGDTIMQDLLELEDEWILGQETTMDIYQRFKYHGLPASATIPCREMIEGWLLDYNDAYHKRCPQAVEGYSHLTRSELNRRIKACETMLGDLDRIKSVAKATRKVRIKKPVAADKQVARVQYCKMDRDFKLESINPVQIIGKYRLFTFNVKTRILTEYFTQAPDGFIISGSTIKNFAKEFSRCTKLRKPDEFLSGVLSKTPKQIDVSFKQLTTKINVPNGRINKDTILLRVMDK